SVVLASALVVDLGAFTAAHPAFDQSGQLERLNSPTGWYAAVLAVASPLYAVFTGLFVLTQILAFRRSTGERRQQLKWQWTGGAISVSGFSLLVIVGPTGSRLGQILSIVGFVAGVALPIGMGIGILKYRLYDIDRLISRTLSYTIVTGLLA